MVEAEAVSLLAGGSKGVEVVLAEAWSEGQGQRVARGHGGQHADE